MEIRAQTLTFRLYQVYTLHFKIISCFVFAWVSDLKLIVLYILSDLQMTYSCFAG